MKIEKLESLLNKVVEYHVPDEVYVKGFLYKDNNGSSLKSTLAGEAFFEEIVSVYFNNWIGKLILPKLTT